jgi:hypothetical protein
LVRQESGSQTFFPHAFGIYATVASLNFKGHELILRLSLYHLDGGRDFFDYRNGRRRRRNSEVAVLGQAAIQEMKVLPLQLLNASL